MSLLENKKLKKAAGLLNSEAPDDHFLAYITADERDMLVNAGGVKTPTKSGVFAYPGHHGSSGSSMGVQQGSSNNNNQGSDQGHSRFEVGSGYYGEPVTKTTPKNDDNNNTVTLEEPTFTGEGYDTTNTFEKPPSKAQEFFDDIKEFVGSGGIIGNTIKGIAELGVPMQKKMMTYSLNKRIDQISNKKDFHPGAYGYKIQDIQKDLQGVQDGTFTQNDFTKKYGSGDATNPNDASFNPATLRENDRELSNLITPYAAYAIGESEPQESVASKWYEGMNNQNGADFFFKNQYEDAKAKMKAILGTPSSIGQVAVGNSIFYNFLKQNSLNKGIL
tara:strand:+ start:1700 stop:2695 length:996 start_codon:yes stop_codon:yes gene_type:complete